jgi:hypothetical protein
MLQPIPQMDKEQVFKQSIADNLDETLIELGYSRTHEYKGVVEYRNSNNILTFVFEWNQAYGFYCQLQFANEQTDYPLSTVINRLKNSNQTEPGFGTEFPELINKWTSELKNEIPELGINLLTKTSVVIQALRSEFDQRTLEYNQQLELESVKRTADEAWNSKNYQNYLNAVNDKLEQLPSSYSKKLSIAKKRITEKNGL